MKVVLFLIYKVKGALHRPLSMNKLLCVFSEVSGERRYSITEVKIIVPQYKKYPTSPDFEVARS